MDTWCDTTIGLFNGETEALDVFVEPDMHPRGRLMACADLLAEYCPGVQCAEAVQALVHFAHAGVDNPSWSDIGVRKSVAHAIERLEGVGRLIRVYRALKKEHQPKLAEFFSDTVLGSLDIFNKDAA